MKGNIRLKYERDRGYSHIRCTVGHRNLAVSVSRQGLITRTEYWLSTGDGESIARSRLTSPAWTEMEKLCRVLVETAQGDND